MYLLDTDFLVELLRNNRHALSKLKEIINKENEIYTSSINLHELIKGASISTNQIKNLESVSKLIQTISILSFDKETSFISGKIEAQQERRGKPIGQNDVFIAAIAIKNKLTLLTRNKKHFDSIENLPIEEW